MIVNLDTFAHDTLLTTTDIFTANRILWIQPHYDGNDIGAGAVLAALVEKGAEIVLPTI